MQTMCEVCMHHCSLREGQKGICRARKNTGGKILCENYGQITSLALDPIEKKPLKQAGMKNVLVTNGTASIQVLNEILPYIDAMNIDLKGFREDYYRKIGGDLETVKAFIVEAAAKCHVELTTLIVPGENDSEKEMEKEAEWIASVGKDIPLHITRFFPRYHMLEKEATQVGQIHRLVRIAGKYLENVFAGNC